MRLSKTLLSALALTFFPSVAFAGQFTEDFTSTAFEDTFNTTADWDTLSGELKLFPFVPSLAGSYDTPAQALDVAVAGNLAFVADFSSGLQIVDISDPTAPTFVGSYDTPGSAYGVAVDGDLAFVADQSSGLQIIDISDPTTPILTGTFPTSSAWGVAVDGDVAFVADGLNNRLVTIHIYDPTTPIIATSYDLTDYVWDVVVTGDLAFVANNASGLQVFDISNPAGPVLAGSYDTAGAAHGVAVDGDLVFVADDVSGLQIVDVSNPAAPTLVGSYDTPGEAFGVAVTGNLAFVADISSGLQVIDVSNPALPTLVESYDTPGTARSVAVAGDRAFVADGISGLQAIQVSEPAPPTLTGTCDTPGIALRFAVRGNHAFVADSQGGLEVVDISDPTTPTVIGSYASPSNAWGIAVEGDRAFVTDRTDGLQILDISDPSAPSLVGICDTPGYPIDVAVAGNYAFVADSDSGLQVIDIFNPTTPLLIGNYDTPGYARGIAVAGNYAFVADGAFGLQVIDISDPQWPAFVGSYATSLYGNDVVVDGNLAFVASLSTGLRILDISDPSVPSLVGSYDTPGDANDVTVSGNFAFVGDGLSGLQVIDISDPSAPTLVRGYDTVSYTYSAVVAGNQAFVADGSSGLRVVQVFQNEFTLAYNLGRSLAVDGASDPILRARLSSTQTAGVSWELSADGGTTFDAVTAGADWMTFATPGSDLIWRSTHAWVGPGINPAVSDLTIEWLNEFALIASVADVPNDQGKQVRVEWMRSGHDFVGDAQQIVEYAVYRQIDPNLVRANPQVASLALDDLGSAAREDALLMQAASWDYVTTVPVGVEDHYAVVVATLADSTIAGGSYLTTFMVRALTATPGVFFQSPPDSGYSVDNLAPAVPEGFAIAYYTGSGNQLAWDPCPDPDFQYFNIYRSSDPNFVPSPSDLVHSATGTGWTDPDYDGGNIYYKVTALDFAGNESDPAEPETVTAVNEPVSPKTFALYPNVPNPFNPRTTIRFELKHATHATLQVFDAAGRLVNTLVNEERNSGIHEVIWQGKDSSGNQVATGVYLYRLRAGDFVETKRMVLLK